MVASPSSDAQYMGEQWEVERKMEQMASGIYKVFLKGTLLSLARALQRDLRPILRSALRTADQY